jgi:hypothetical protein
MLAKFRLLAVRDVFKILKRQTGLIKTLQIFSKFPLYLTDNPWKRIPAPKNKKERISRKMLSPLIILYQILKRDLSEEKALKILEEIIFRISVMFMKKQIPKIDSERLKILEKKEREDYILNISGRFFNAEINKINSTPQTFTYIIDQCYFAYLLKKIKCPELCQFFCKADFLYFQQNQPEITFERNKTLAEGHDFCDFHFTLKDPD